MTQLQSQFAHAGAEMHIEKAIPAGKNPLKQVQWENEFAGSSHDQETLRHRERDF
jgi:hypothetical protein